MNSSLVVEGHDSGGEGEERQWIDGVWRNFEQSETCMSILRDMTRRLIIDTPIRYLPLFHRIL